jgi:hypothetical protein
MALGVTGGVIGVRTARCGRSACFLTAAHFEHRMKTTVRPDAARDSDAQQFAHALGPMLRWDMLVVRTCVRPLRALRVARSSASARRRGSGSRGGGTGPWTLVGGGGSLPSVTALMYASASSSLRESSCVRACLRARACECACGSR